MARIRSVKPSLRTSRVVARWDFVIRYFFVLLWGYLDDKGRGLDIPKTIAGDCFPLDDKITPAVVNRWLTLMATTKDPDKPDRAPPLCRYEVSGTRYVHSVYWDEHQKPNRPQPSKLPPCPIHDAVSEPGTDAFTESFSESRTADALSHSVPGIRRRGEGEKGRVLRAPFSEPPGPSEAGPEPPRQCQDHKNDPDPPPCRRCRAARERWQTWAAARRQRDADAPKCTKHRGQPAANCAPCRSEELNPA